MLLVTRFSPAIKGIKSAVSKPHFDAHPEAAIELEQSLSELRIRTVTTSDVVQLPGRLGCKVSWPRLQLVIRGKCDCKISIGGAVESLTISPGEMLFFAPQSWNLTERTQNCTLISLHFGNFGVGASVTTLSETRFSAKTTIVPYTSKEVVDRIISAMERVQAPCKNEVLKELGRALLKIVIHDVRAKLALHSRGRRPARQHTYQAICAYLRTNFEKHLSRTQIAEAFSITPNYLSTLFKRRGRSTLTDYITQLRIAHSREVLMNHALSVKQVAAECGYTDPGHFCRVFKRTNGITANQFRMRINRGTFRHRSRPGPRKQSA